MSGVIFKTLLSITTLILFSMPVMGQFRLLCSWSDNIFTEGCYFQDQQLYNQRKVSDNHCVPTAASMSLSAITFGGISHYANSWTANNFVFRSDVERITNMGILMETSSTDGTFAEEGKRFQNLASDIPSATGNIDEAYNQFIGDYHIKARILAGESDVLVYGHYTEDCDNFLGLSICAYRRDGGHAVSVNGYFYYKYNGGLRTKFHDPWNATIKHRDLKQVPDKSHFPGIDNRPFGYRTSSVYQSGSAVKIVEHIMGIDTN